MSARRSGVELMHEAGRLRQVFGYDDRAIQRLMAIEMQLDLSTVQLNGMRDTADAIAALVGAQ